MLKVHSALSRGRVRFLRPIEFLPTLSDSQAEIIFAVGNVDPGVSDNPGTCWVHLVDLESGFLTRLEPFGCARFSISPISRRSPNSETISGWI